MLDRTIDRHAAETVANRRRFCEANGVSYDNTVYQVVSYGDTVSYNKLADVTERDTTNHIDGIEGDALFTDQPGIGLFLPVADCIATVVYDPKQHVLAVLHMGRHSTLSNLIELAVKRFRRAGSNLQDCIVWMSPSAQATSYKLQWFAAKDNPSWQGFYEVRDGEYYIDMQGYNKAQFVRHGVLESNIHVSQVDTMTDERYFSHANGDTSGRSALFAIMR